MTNRKCRFRYLQDTSKIPARYLKTPGNATTNKLLKRFHDFLRHEPVSVRKRVHVVGLNQVVKS